MANYTSLLNFVDHENVKRSIGGCQLTVDHLDRHWIYSEQLQCNIVYKTTGRENALIASIDSLLFMIHLRDERIAELQRIANLAKQFADQIKPDEEEI
jgi:hypothetical protein